MNAHAPTTSSAVLTPTALQHAPLLRALRDRAPDDTTSKSAFAAAVGHDHLPNFNRLLKSLEQAGLVGEAPQGGLPLLTGAGRAAMDFLDRAEGGGEAVAQVGGAAVGSWPHDKVAANPLNPRKHFDAEELNGLAESIEGPAGVIAPLVLYPADDQGVRIIYDGERRWRAVGLLVAAGRLPADYALPFVERDAPTEERETQALVVGLVANNQHATLSDLETARAYADLMARTGWSAREAAMKTGANPRVVQEGVKVVREARPDDIERHVKDPDSYSFQWLRNSVRDLELPPTQALVLIELADKADKQPSATSEGGTAWAGCAFEPVGGPAFALAERGLVEFMDDDEGETFGRAKLEDARVDRFLRDQGFFDNRDALLLQARTDAFDATTARLAKDEGFYVTDFLREPDPAQSDIEDWAPTKNPPAAAASQAQPLQQDALAIDPPAARPPEDKPLSPGAFLALVELAHKALADPAVHHVEGRPEGRIAAVGQYWLAAEAAELVAAKAVAWTNPGPPLGWHGIISDHGMDLLARAATDQLAILDMDEGGRIVALDALMQRAREAVRKGDHEGPGYATPFINAAPAPTITAVNPASPPTDDDGDDAADAAALEAARAFTPDGPDFAPRLAALFHAVGIPADGGLQVQDTLLVMADGAPVLAVDADGRLSDALAQARAIAIAHAINAALGVQTGEG